MTGQASAPAGDAGLIAGPPAAAAPAWRQWLAQGARSALFMAPRWRHLRVTPAAIGLAALANVALTILFDRLFIDGPASFHWEAVAGGWLGMALTAWACYLVRPGAGGQAGRPALAPGAAHLFMMSQLQSLLLTAVGSLYFVALLRASMLDELSEPARWLAWMAPVAWFALAQLTLLLRCGERKRWPMLGAALALAAATLSHFVLPAPDFWREQEESTPAPRLELTQSVIEAQAPLLGRRLAALKPQRPAAIDMYTITFAPYAGEEVFRRESRMVAQVMAQRFDAGGRGLQLINHAGTAAQLPWATPLNLRRAILGMAAIMDREQDVLFIHLASHGAANGELAASFEPLEVEPVMPADLKAWLDEAGIVHRVISISACYSGSWIGPLANAGTLVMTASDAENTSYGCGRKSDLTFFGRAMYDEQLRSRTLSFEAAHAAAREVILERERAAGKDDGYSNPQIEAGAAIGRQLLRMRGQLAGAGPRQEPGSR